MDDQKALLRKRKESARKAAAEVPANRPRPVDASPIIPTQVVTPSWEMSKYFFFGGCIVFILVVLVSVFKFTTFGVFTIDPKTGTVGRVPVSSETIVSSQYTSSPIPTNVSTTFKDVVQSGYTVGFDVFIGDGTPINNYYRILFYNGCQTPDPAVPSNDPSQDYNTGTAISFNDSDYLDGASIDDIQGYFSGANYTNLCMYMDPLTNDIYLMYSQGDYAINNQGDPAVDENGYYIQVPDSMAWNISEPIKNVPIGKPFRVTLAVDPQFVETYINGELVLVTKTFYPGNPSSLFEYYDTTQNYNFYGPPDVIYTAGNSVDHSKGIKVANFTYWGQVLPSKSIRLFSSNPANSSVFLK